jgi:hypothetical protein
LKILFCYNQVSYSLAKNIENNGLFNNVIVISQKRISRTINKNGIFEVNYNTFLAFIVLIISIFPIGVEIVIPHTRGGKILNIISKIAYKLSYIDDGMDTFREIPKNVDLSQLRSNSNYFTFDYKISIATWLKDINIIKVIGINELTNDGKLAIDLEIYQNVIIESPGIIGYDFRLVDSKYFVIQHSNPNKNINQLKLISNQNGKNFSLEKTLKSYRGEIILGETFILIYLICSNYNLSNITLCLYRSDYNNLKCLHLFFEQCKKMIIID